MSVFKSSFDWFERYASESLTARANGDGSTLGVALNGTDSDATPLERIEHPFDPFNWLLADAGQHSMAGAALESEVSNGALPVATQRSSDPAERSHFDSQIGTEGAGASPADRWLSGNEWHDGLSSGSVDTSGQGNDVFSVGGEVLSLPT